MFNYSYGPFGPNTFKKFHIHTLIYTKETGVLTGDVIVCETLELESHVVGTELLELDGEFDVFLWLVARHQDIWVQYSAAGLRLLFLHQVEFIKLIRPPHVPLRADNVQFIPNLWVDHQAFPRHKPATQNEQCYYKSHTLNPSPTVGKIRIPPELTLKSGKTWVQTPPRLPKLSANHSRGTITIPFPSK